MRVLVYVAIGSLTLGLAGCKKETANNPPAQTPGQKVGGAVDAATQSATGAKDNAVSHIAPSGSADLTGIRSALEGVLDNVLGKNDLKSAASHFTGPDEQRIKAAELDQAALNAEIAKFKETWKGKYNDNFAVMDADKVFAADFATLTSSDSSNAPVKSGTATLKGVGDLPELKVPMVAENGKWRVDVPDDVDGPKLLQNVLAATQKLNTDVTAWPADKGQAERVVARRILGAVLNTK